MLGKNGVKKVRKAQFGPPDSGLIGFERAMGQLNIEDSVIDISGTGPRSIEQKLRLGLLPQHTIFHAKLVIRQLELCDARQFKSIVSMAHFTIWIGPDDDPSFFKLGGEAFSDAVLH